MAWMVDADGPVVLEPRGGHRARRAMRGLGMRFAAKVIGVVLILLGVVLVPIGLGALPLGAIAGHVIWTGWGSVSIAFGAGFLVWANRERPAP